MTDFRRSNIAILTILAALDFDFLGIFDIFISEIFLIKIQSLQNC